MKGKSAGRACTWGVWRVCAARAVHVYEVYVCVFIVCSIWFCVCVSEVCGSSLIAQAVKNPPAV